MWLRVSSLDSRPLTIEQVLHATPILHDTLTNVRTLLQPSGQLFLQELCPGKYSIYDLLERLLTDAVTRAMSFIMVSLHYSLYNPNLSYLFHLASIVPYQTFHQVPSLISQL